MDQAFPAVGDNREASPQRQANRNSLLTSLLHSHNGQVFPPEILSSGNTSCCKGFVLPAQPTRSGSTGAGHRLSTEPAHFRRMICHIHTSPTQQHTGASLTAPPVKNTLPPQQKCSLIPMASRFAMSLKTTVFSVATSLNTTAPHQKLFCASFQTKL